MDKVVRGYLSFGALAGAVVEALLARPCGGLQFAPTFCGGGWEGRVIEAALIGAALLLFFLPSPPEDRRKKRGKR